MSTKPVDGNGRPAQAPGSTSPASATVVRVGLIGSGIGLSRTPAMHEAEGARHGLDYRYELFDIDEMGDDDASLQTLIANAERRGYAGLNITYPFKQSVLNCLSELSSTAEAVGSVNTVVFKDGLRIGHNTDLSGFAQSFDIDMRDVARKSVLLIGAGGAGSAVASALLQCGVEQLSISDTDEQRARQLARRLNADRRYSDGRNPVARAVHEAAGHIGSVDGVVNATPVGMAKFPGSSFPVGLLSADMWVAEIIYFPLETELLRAARELGCRTLSGSGMAVYQALHAFELFTGIRPEYRFMKATFDTFGT